jgi:hypothetical protein
MIELDIPPVFWLQSGALFRPKPEPSWTQLNSALGKAYDYVLGRWSQLSRFLSHGQLEAEYGAFSTSSGLDCRCAL